MIYCRMPEGTFHFRIAGVLIRNGQILVQRPIEGHGYALPGGHVEMFERSEDTLVREYREEMGAAIKVGRLLWIQEQMSEWGNAKHHSVCFYYLVELDGDGGIPHDGAFRSSAGNDSELEFSWVDIDRLKDMEFYPRFAKERLHQLPLAPERVVEQEITG